MATSTPWGSSQQTKEVAPGIIWYSTASHGGYHLSQSRLNEMQEPYRSHKPWAGTGWYEEDCDWCVVYLAFRAVFAATDEHFDRNYEAAVKTYKSWIEPKQA